MSDINANTGAIMSEPADLVEKRAKLAEACGKFKRSCDQVMLLNQRLADLQKRYVKAKSENQRGFRYSLKIRLATTETMRYMFLEYIKQQGIMVMKCKREMEECVYENMTTSEDEESDTDEQ
ncbi:hypothetical protein KUTeg_009362 [Tegillarca granosa]|uniref:Uncharacterized protein n=1 Tax=Tegillarca granosa TaxID=220873 RepID=A0ABQ9F3M0_TEGGR|nr:hypothetical protein KUTeg_009362 [Tegillarca granosa]